METSSGVLIINTWHFDGFSYWCLWGIPSKRVSIGRHQSCTSYLRNSCSSPTRSFSKPLLDSHIQSIFPIAAAAKSLQSCPTLCDPIVGSPPGSPIPGILHARTLEWVAISFSNAWKWKVKSEREVVQSCPTLRDTMNCSLPGSSIHGIFQARVLEWVAIALRQ